MLSDMKSKRNRLYYALSVFTSVFLAVSILLFSGCKTPRPESTGTRYVVLSPEIAEIISVIEGTDNIVGITEECNFPDTYEGKVVVGKFGTLNKERIISLRPSIVFATSLEQQAIASELAKLGIKVITVYPKTIAEMLTGIQTVGTAIGKAERASFCSRQFADRT